MNKKETLLILFAFTIVLSLLSIPCAHANSWTVGQVGMNIYLFEGMNLTFTSPWLYQTGASVYFNDSKLNQTIYSITGNISGADHYVNETGDNMTGALTIRIPNDENTALNLIGNYSVDDVSLNMKNYANDGFVTLNFYNQTARFGDFAYDLGTKTFLFDNILGSEMLFRTNSYQTRLQISGANVNILSGNLSVAKNVSAQYYFGDGSKLTGITATSINETGGWKNDTVMTKTDLNVNITGTLYVNNISSNSPLKLKTSDTTRMTFDNNGDVNLSNALFINGTTNTVTINGTTRITGKLVILAVPEESTPLDIIGLFDADDVGINIRNIGAGGYVTLNFYNNTIRQGDFAYDLAAKSFLFDNILGSEMLFRTNSYQTRLQIVGANVNIPSGNLSVAKNVSAQYYFGNGSFLTGITSASSINETGGWYNSTTTTHTNLNANVTGDLNVDNYSLYVKSSTNMVGIGTNNPVIPLEIKAEQPRLRLTDQDGTTIFTMGAQSSTVNNITYNTGLTSAQHKFQIGGITLLTISLYGSGFGSNIETPKYLLQTGYNTWNPGYDVNLSDTLYVNGSSKIANVTGDLEVTAKTTITGISLRNTTTNNATFGKGAFEAGVAIVNTTRITPNSIVFVTYYNCSNCQVYYVAERLTGVSFTVRAEFATDFSGFNWLLIEPS